MITDDQEKSINCAAPRQFVMSSKLCVNPRGKSGRSKTPRSDPPKSGTVPLCFSGGAESTYLAPVTPFFFAKGLPSCLPAAVLSTPIAWQCFPRLQARSVSIRYRLNP